MATGAFLHEVRCQYLAGSPIRRLSMRRSKTLLALLAAATLSTTSWFLPAEPTKAAPFTISDRRFDVRDGRADVTLASFAMEDDVVVMVFGVDVFATPSVDWGWTFGTTAAIWYVDVNLDGFTDYTATLDNFAGRLQGTLYLGESVSSGVRVCSALLAQADRDSRSYAMGFDASCLGYPRFANWKLGFVYDGFVYGSEVDLVPDFGWAGPAVRTLTAPPVTSPPVTSPPATSPPTTIAPTSPATGVATLVASRPARVFDSRAAGGRRAAGSVTEVRVDSVRSLPRDARAIMATVTAVDPQAAGYVTLFPCGSPMPEASNLNFVAGQTVPNTVLTRAASRSSVCVYTSAATHLIVDVAGHAPAGSALQPVTPWRALDTRSSGRVAAGVERQVRVDRARSVPADSAAVLVNVTAVNPSTGGYLSVYPCGRGRPEASSVNFAAGQTVPNAVLAKVGSNSSICVWSSVDTEVLVDVNGSIARSASFTASDPVRVFDSRSLGRASAGSVTQIPITGLGGIPANASTMVLNVTVTDPTSSGYASVFPCGQSVPDASNLNFAVGQTVANAVVTGVGSGSSVCVFSSAATHLIIDVNGYDTGGATVRS